MKENRRYWGRAIWLVAALVMGLPLGLRADYAPDGIAGLWWTASRDAGQLPDHVLVLNAGWESEQSGEQTEWWRTLAPLAVPDPVLVLANIGAEQVEILLGGQTIYAFGETAFGVARIQAANAVHWVSIPPAAEGRELRVRIQSRRQRDPVADLPMILYAASTPLLRHLLRTAAGRIVLALLFVFVGLYAGLAWWVRRRYGMRFSPWFAVLTTSLGLALLIAAVMEFLPPSVAARFYYAGLLFILLFPAALWRFMEESLGAGPWKLIRRCWQLQVVVAALLWLPDVLGLRAFDTGAQILGNSVLALQLGVGVWMGARHVRNGDDSQRWVALGIFLLSLSGLIDIAGAVLVGNPTFELYPFGALALIASLAYSQERAAGEAQRRLRRQAEALRRHQTHLEEQVEARTAQLRETTQAAQAASRAKSEFLANMSHELRTPLNAILGHAQLLRSDAAAPPSNRERGEIIRQSGEHLLTLINDVLDLARIEAGRLEIQPGAVDLPALLAGVVEMLRPRAEQKSLAFAFETATPLPGTIEADGRRMRQILLNLLGNAIKFTERGSVRLEVSHPDGQLLFTVIDTGPGLSADEIARIFEAFEQGDGAGGGEGTGLGLSISRTLAERMGGEIGVESQPGHGSRFWLRLPCRVIDADSPAAAIPAQPPSKAQTPTRTATLPASLPSDYQTLIDAARIGDLATVIAEIPFLRQRYPDHAPMLDELERMAAAYDVASLQGALDHRA